MCTFENLAEIDEMDGLNPMFEHDMLMAMIALHEGECGNVIDLDACSQVARSLIKEEDELPLHLLGKKKTDNA